MIEDIRNEIESMNKFHQIEVLKILKEDKSIVLNDNNNGVFVKMNDMSEDTIVKLKNYIAYVKQQEKQLTKQEHLKEEYKSAFFDIKDGANEFKDKRTKNVKIENESATTS